MNFPPIKPDRALLMIALEPDPQAVERWQQLQPILKQCRLHPLDTSPGAQIVIVEAEALRAQLSAVQAVLGPNDMLHLITAHAGRLSIQAITGPEAAADRLPDRPPARRPVWLRAE